LENSEKIHYLKRKRKEKVFQGLILIFSLMAVIPLFLVIGYVFIKGIKAINWSFFTQLPTPVGEPGGGMANAIVGSGMIVLLASLLGLPVGVMGGVWLALGGSGRLGFVIRYAADVLTSIPSIVVGIFAYTLLVYPFKRFSAIAGGFALAIIIIPNIIRTTEELIKMVPTTLRESALALGIPEWRVTLSVVLRTAWNGIFTGIILALARAAGETAPLLFTSFNNQFWSFKIDQPTASLTVQIYNYAISPFAEWQEKAWAGSLVLIFLVLGITLFVRKFSKKVTYV
jgi:phosphate transport system permease protein